MIGMLGFLSTATFASCGSENDAARSWAAAHFAAAGTPAVSFVYDGKAFDPHDGPWKTSGGRNRLPGGRTEWTVTYSRSDGGLEVQGKALVHDDAPAVEWVFTLRNGGSKPTPILEKIQALDAEFAVHAGKTVLLHRSLGDSNSAASFAPVDDDLAEGSQVVLSPTGGRSSEPNLPFFNLDLGGRGVAMAVGWSGQWEARFARPAATRTTVVAGQQLTHLRLLPGEEIRTPRMLLVFWAGDDPIRGNNLMRRYLLDHVMPRRDGRPVLAPICASVGWTDPDGGYEGPHLAVLPGYAKLGVEVFWSDMDPQQWYPGGFPEGTGTWEVDRTKYPDGLGVIGEAAHKLGLQYLLWFEPERVNPGTKIDRDHPQWVMRPQGEWSCLFNLGDPAARKWMTELLDRYVKEAHLDWLRWDFNIGPLGFWRRADSPDRQGITEIRYVDGLYALWDDLIATNKGLVIDLCASGGRRIDIESLRRGVPLWHSDMQCDGPKPAADQLQNGGLFRWVPLHGCGCFGLEPSYAFRSAMTTGNILAVQGVDNPVIDPAVAEGVRRSVAIFKKVRPYMLGDFYPLFPHSSAETAWYGYQFHLPEDNAGVAFVFRRSQCGDDHAKIAPRGIDPRKVYDVSFQDSGERRVLKGAELASLNVRVPSAPGSELVFYAPHGK